MERKEQEAAQTLATEVEVRRLQKQLSDLESHLSPGGYKRSLNPPKQTNPGRMDMSPLSLRLKQAQEEEENLKKEIAAATKKQKLEELEKKNEMMRNRIANMQRAPAPVVPAWTPSPQTTRPIVPPKPPSVPPTPPSVPPTPTSLPPTPTSVPPTPTSLSPTPPSVPTPVPASPSPKAPNVPDLQRASPLQHQASNVSNASTSVSTEKPPDPATR